MSRPGKRARGETEGGLKVRRKLLLFDVDGTLILSGGAGIRSVDRAFLSLFGVSGAMSRCHPDGKTDPAIFREVARATLARDLSPAEMEAVKAAYLGALREEIRDSPGYRIMPGVPDLLGRLAREGRFLMALATGNLEEGARLKLEPADLNRYFDTGGFGSDDEDRPRLVRAAVRRAASASSGEIPDEDVYVIGDTPHDITAARKAGVRCIAVATGSSPAAALALHEPDAVLEDLSDAAAFLSALEITRGAPAGE